MDKVNLFLIGVHKAGTSWLYYLLNAHPEIFMPEVKELYFFGEEGRSDERPSTLQAYHRHYPFEESYQYFGDASALYYRSEQAAAEIQAYNPTAKILAIVRDPIQRALSQYRYRKQLGLIEETTTLDECLQAGTPTFIRDSHYENTLPAYIDRFGPDQCMMLSLEEGRDDPEAFWSGVQTFLDLSPTPLPSKDDRPENPTGGAWFRWVYRHTVRPVRRHAPGVYRWMLENPAVRQIKLGLLRVLGTAEKETLTPEQRERLREEFAPTYAYLRGQGFDVYD